MAPDTPHDSAVERSREHRRGVRQACTDLEHALARPPAPSVSSWSESVSEALGELAEAFSRHVRHSEGPDGLLPDVTSTAPRLAHAVDLVRLEHVAILAQVEQVRSLAGENEEADRVPEIREESLVLLQSVAAHRYRGADLVYDAFSVDIEAAD